MRISSAIRRNIAEKVVEQAHPGYSKMAQGEWYTDGERLYHAEDNRAWDPWPDGALVISVDDLVYEFGGAQEAHCDFSPAIESGIDDRYDALKERNWDEWTTDEQAYVDQQEAESFEESVLFCVAYVPAEIHLED